VRRVRFWQLHRAFGGAMNLTANAERMITGLLAQLALAQQTHHSMEEMERFHRFQAVMLALDMFHAVGRASQFPHVHPDASGAFLELDYVLTRGIEQGLMQVEDHEFRITMTADQAYNILRCFSAGERASLEWLAGVFADPSMATQSIPGNA
jgi:hypothetical protein